MISGGFPEIYARDGLRPTPSKDLCSGPVAQVGRRFILRDHEGGNGRSIDVGLTELCWSCGPILYGLIAASTWSGDCLSACSKSRGQRFDTFADDSTTRAGATPEGGRGRGSDVIVL